MTVQVNPVGTLLIISMRVVFFGGRLAEGARKARRRATPKLGTVAQQAFVLDEPHSWSHTCRAVAAHSGLISFGVFLLTSTVCC